MSDELFNVIFRGDVLPGFLLADVKARFGQLFKMEAAKVEQFFSGRPVVLKANCDRATADKFKAVLTQAGALVEVRSASPAAPSPSTAAPSPPPPKPAAAAAVPPVDPWSVAPAGNLVRPGEIPQPAPVQVDTSHISLVKRNPFSTDPEPPLEPDHDVPPPPLDLSALSLAEAGEQLVPYQEFIPADIDLSELVLEPPGTAVLREDERQAFVPRDVDTSAMNLAAAGADLGEIPPPPAPPPPPTDHLSTQK